MAAQLSSLSQALPLVCLVPPAQDCLVYSGLASDVPSEMLRGARRGCLLVTSHASLNTVAVACHTGVPGIIFTGGGHPPDEAIEAAQREGIALYRTELDTFSVVGKLFQLGIGGIES